MPTTASVTSSPAGAAAAAGAGASAVASAAVAGAGVPVLSRIQPTTWVRVGKSRNLRAVVAGNAVVLADRGEHLGLLDGVHTEVGLQVKIHIEQIRRITGQLGHDAHHGVGHLITGGSRRSHRRRRYRRRFRRPWSAAATCTGWTVGACAGAGDGATVAGGPVSTIRSRCCTTSSCGSCRTGGLRQPAPPGRLVDDPVLIPEFVRQAVATVGHRRPAHQRHRDLRTESSDQAAARTGPDSCRRSTG